MAKLTLTDLANLQNETTAVTAINNNNTAIETAMEKTLSRDGTSPNTMNADLDMNSNQILNLPDATSDQEPVTYGQFVETITAIEAGAAVAAPFVTMSNVTGLTAERVLTAGTNIGITDGGENSTVTIAVNGADLNAYEALGTTGLVSRTGSGTVSTRTVTGTANEITVTNGDGVSANPTVSLPSALTFTGKTITGGTFNSATVNTTDNSFAIYDNSDNTKGLQFEVSGVSTGTTRTLTVPNANTTIVGTDATQTLTNKTLTAPVISTISNTGTLTLPTSTDTLVGRATTDTLTNKTLTSPVISTISNTGTLTLPTATTTLVGRDTTDTLTNKTVNLTSNTLSGTTAQFNTALSDNDFATLAGSETLTNKTLTAPVISTISNTGTLTLPTSTDTLVARATTDTLTNKTMSGASNTFSNIALSQHATQAAYTFVGNNTGSAAAPTAVDIAGLTTKASPAAGDYLIVSDQSASGAWKKSTVSSVSSAGSVSSIGGVTGAISLGGAMSISGSTLSDGWSTGDVKTTIKTTADTGWVMCNDGTIGNGSSGGTTRANADTSALFTLLWDNISNTWAAVSGGRGASAAADFAANKTIALPKFLGRALAASGSGSGLTTRSLGQTNGAETKTIATANLPAHTHGTTAASQYAVSAAGGTQMTITGGTNALTDLSGVVTGSTGSGTALDVMNPMIFLNYMIKL